MILKEEHAKTSMCPLLAVRSLEGSSCKTKNCMMWVYLNEAADTTQGYCGLVFGHAIRLKQDDSFHMVT